MCCLHRYLRAWAQAIGWHQSIGAMVPYAQELLATGTQLVKRAASSSLPKALSAESAAEGAGDDDGTASISQMIDIDSE